MTQKDTKKYVAITESGTADAKRFHIFQDCGTLRNRGPDDFEEVSDREARLLGLKVCTVCDRRHTGGPVIEALKEVFLCDTLSPVDDSPEHLAAMAWELVSELKKRGMFITQRGTRTTTDKPTEKSE